MLLFSIFQKTITAAMKVVYFVNTVSVTIQNFRPYIYWHCIEAAERIPMDRPSPYFLKLFLFPL
jgi:hypothetical protein